MHESENILNLMLRMREERKPYVLATVVRCELPTSGKPGQKAVVDTAGNLHGWIGGGCAQPAVLEHAALALTDGVARLIRISPVVSAQVGPGITEIVMSCHSGGTLDIFLEPVLPRTSLVIIGGTESARHLAQLARPLEFSVTVAWPEADEVMFPGVDRLLQRIDANLLQHPGIVVIATQGKRDEEALETALATGASHIALVASRRKWQKLRQYLAERGWGRDDLARIHAPAGLDIGAVSPAEIALSVMAQLVSVRRSRVPAEAVTDTPSADMACGCDSGAAGAVEPVQAGRTASAGASATAVDPVCGMRVSTAGAEYSLEHAGEMYYFCCAGCLHQFRQQHAPLVNIQAG